MDKPTITDFGVIPTDILARIAREAGAGVLSKSGGWSTINDRIHDAGTSPFVKREIEWLMSVKRNMAILCERDGDARCYQLYNSMMKYNDVTTVCDILVAGGGQHGRNRSRVYGVSQLEDVEYIYISRSDLVDDLTNRFGSDITKIVISEQLIVGYNPQNRRKHMTNVIILDIHGVFKILKNRFQIMEVSDSTVLARKYTQLFLNSIVDDFQGNRLSALMIYLLSNVSSMGREINVDDYITNELESEKYFTEKCKELYEIVTEEISDMK